MHQNKFNAEKIFFGQIYRVLISTLRGGGGGGGGGGGVYCSQFLVSPYIERVVGTNI